MTAVVRYFQNHSSYLLEDPESWPGSMGFHDFNCSFFVRKQFCHSCIVTVFFFFGELSSRQVAVEVGDRVRGVTECVYGSL